MQKTGTSQTKQFINSFEELNSYYENGTLSFFTTLDNKDIITKCLVEYGNVIASISVKSDLMTDFDQELLGTAVDYGQEVLNIAVPHPYTVQSLQNIRKGIIEKYEKP